MGKRGPKPTPTKMLELRGSWRAKRNPDEPQPDSGLPGRPAWVMGQAEAFWGEVAQLLCDHGVMTPMDGVALGLLCDALAQYIEAKIAVEKHGLTVTTDKGNVIQRPEVGAANKAWERVMKALREFGMTPSSRTAVAISKKAGEVVNAKARFFKDA